MQRTARRPSFNLTEHRLFDLPDAFEQRQAGGSGHDVARHERCGAGCVQEHRGQVFLVPKENPNALLEKGRQRARGGVADLGDLFRERGINRQVLRIPKTLFTPPCNL
jgi:hypothetical protein